MKNTQSNTKVTARTINACIGSRMRLAGAPG
jgi:hypothetical protein